MKKQLITTALSGLLGVCAYAQGTSAPPTLATSPQPLTSGYNSGRFGAGVIIGEPTGLSLKYWLNDTMAVDGAAGWSYADDTDFYLHSDVLWHKFDLLRVPEGSLPLYFGVGGLVRFRNDNRDNEVGVRAPVGLSYIFDRIPVDIFVEIAPAIDVAPSVRADITGGIGVRYWF